MINGSKGRQGPNWKKTKAAPVLRHVFIRDGSPGPDPIIKKKNLKIDAHGWAYLELMLQPIEVGVITF